MHHYNHSGTVPLRGLIGTVLAAVPSTMVLAVVYSYTVVYIPFTYVNLLATLCFGCAAGWVVGWGATVGKIRNTPVVGLLGFAAGVLGLYAAWAVDPLARLGPADGFLALDPQVLAGYIQWFYENGAWTVGSGEHVVTGPPLACVWFAEAGLIIGAAVTLAVRAVGRRPFCEPCDQWTDIQKDVRRFLVGGGPEHRAALLDRLAVGDLAPLSELRPAANHDPDYLRLDLARCPTCSESTYLTLSHCTLTQPRKRAKPTTKTKTILTNLHTTEEALGAILHLCNHLSTDLPVDDSTTATEDEPQQGSEWANGQVGE